VDARSRGTTVPVVLGKTGDVVLHEKKFDLSPIAFPLDSIAMPCCVKA
jgi:hypothetical protein